MTPEQPMDLGPQPYRPPNQATEPRNATTLRQGLVAALQRQGLVNSAVVADALRGVPRHHFLPQEPLERAYADEAIVTKWDTERMPISSASQPAMVAIMLEQLGAQPGMRVLEIGAGTGYNAALLAELVGPHGSVTTVDIDPDTVAAARLHLDASGYAAPRVQVICGDGALGYAPNAPYDRIILTVGAWDVMPDWVRQLTPQGRIVLPLALHTVQMSAALDRQGATLLSASLRPCGFMRLRGPFAGPERLIALPEPAGMKILAEPPVADVTHLAGLLAGPARLSPLDGISAEFMRYLLAFMARDAVSLIAPSTLPYFNGNTTGIMTPEGDSACFIGLEPSGDRITAVLVEYGAATAALQVEDCVARWVALGRPALAQWQLRLHPQAEDIAARPGAFIFPKGHWNAELTVLA